MCQGSASYASQVQTGPSHFFGMDILQKYPRKRGHFSKFTTVTSPVGRLMYLKCTETAYIIKNNVGTENRRQVYNTPLCPLHCHFRHAKSSLHAIKIRTCLYACGLTVTACQSPVPRDTLCCSLWFWSAWDVLHKILRYVGQFLA